MEHDAGDRELAKELTEQFRSLDQSLRELMAANHRGGTTQVVKIDAGGVGILVALILAAFIAGMNITQASSQAKLAAEISDIRRRNDLANDKLSVILQWAPELAKKVDSTTTPKKGENAP